MTERVFRGNLESVLSNAAATLTDRQRLCDVVLMVVLADPFVTKTDLARAVRTLNTYNELEGIPDSWLRSRIEELKDAAPLFSEEREALVRELTDTREQRFALSLAAKLVGSLRPLGEDEKAVIHGLADAFKIPDIERTQIFSPWEPLSGPPDLTGFERTDYNSPIMLERRTLFTAMQEADSESEFRLITHKLRATRYLMNKIAEDADILGLGELIRVGPYAFHADAILEHTVTIQQTAGYQRVVTRFLAPGETLHPLEHGVLSQLVHGLDESAYVLIAHTGDLSPFDRVFIDSYPSTMLRSEHLGV